MVRDPKADWYWPLGALEYQHEIRGSFPEEAEMLGIITILWNRQELALRSLYARLIASKRPAYAEAIWDRQPTHQARRDLLALALHTVKMTKRQAAILTYIIERTKVVADRRNELLHAEYVVHGRTDKLHAKVKPPRSSKPPKHQKVTPKDLQTVIDDLEELLMATERAWMEFLSRSGGRLRDQLHALAAKLREDHGLPQESPRSGSDLQSLRRTHGEEY